MVEHIQTIRRLLPMNCFSVSDYFERLALKGLKTAKANAKISQMLQPGIFYEILQKNLQTLAQDECYLDVICSQFCNFRMNSSFCFFNSAITCTLRPVKMKKKNFFFGGDWEFTKNLASLVKKIVQLKLFKYRIEVGNASSQHK